MIPFLLVLAAAADTTPPICMGTQHVTALEAWGHPAPEGSTLAVGRAVVLTLKPAAGVEFKPSLARPARDGTFGGYFPIDVAKAGRYRIALSQGAWIDLVQKGDRLRSAEHMHGPACSGISKIVAFDLQPGRYWIQLSEVKDATIYVEVAPPSPE